jgi:peptidoglycan/LPS O-acetylase OafA/YrhL
LTAAVSIPDKGRERVLGWDVLRGLCALGVAAYHLMYWQDIATVHTLGSYGVYLFFILSGASLAYNYSGRLHGVRDALAFLATRWLRLAPLYALLCVVFVVFLTVRNGAPVDLLALRFGLNFTFAFGLYDPVIWALLIGGWSLGIEFVYYLVFPVLLAAAGHPRWRWVIAVGLAALQWGWIMATVGSAEGYEASAVAYHQVPAFAAYFFIGCLIGHWRGQEPRNWPQSLGVLCWAWMAFLLLALNPAGAGDELLGLRGLVLFVACSATVACSAQIEVRGRLAPVARWLGDMTYGTYLLHPMFLFGFSWFVLPRWSALDIGQLPMAARLVIFVSVLAASCLTATASERWFESPVRRLGKRWLQRAGRPPPTAPQSEAASMSS